MRLGFSAFVDNRRGGNNTYLTDEQIQDLARKLNQYRPVDLLGLEKVATAEHLKQILAPYLEKQILLFWDRAKWHGGQAVKQLLDDNPRLEIMKYPPASPDLNPQEHVWKSARLHASYNHDCSKLAELAVRFEHFLRTNKFKYSFLEKFNVETICALSK